MLSLSLIDSLAVFSCVMVMAFWSRVTGVQIVQECSFTYLHFSFYGFFVQPYYPTRHRTVRHFAAAGLDILDTFRQTDIYLPVYLSSHLPAYLPTCLLCSWLVG